MACFVYSAPDAASLMERLAQNLEESIRTCLQTQNRCRIALSGGSTPAPVYEILGKNDDLPWERCDFFMVDERFVPSSQSDNNESMIRKAFKQSRLILYAVDTDTSSTSTEAAQKYEAVLKQQFAQETLPVFDIILLGLGPDGHTASLFPGTGAVEVQDKLALPVIPLNAPHERISLSLPVLRAAKRVIFLTHGEAKIEAVSEVLIARNPEKPASHVLGISGKLEFWLDANLVQKAGLKNRPDIILSEKN